MQSVPNKKTEVGLRIVDTLWSCFIVTPLCVFYWSGTWKLVDFYILPTINKPPLISSYISLGIGVAIGLSGYLILPILAEHIDSSQRVKHVIISRLFSYIYAFSVLNFWRGTWNVSDHYLGNDMKWSSVCYIVSILILIVLRSVSTCLSSPFLVIKDHREDFYTTYTVFRSEPSSACKYLLDSLLSHLVVTHLSIQVWRCLWNIMDHFILPNGSLLNSYLISLGTGYCMCLLLFLLQHPFYLIARKFRHCHWIGEHGFEVCIKFLATHASVSIWRGTWGICRDFLLKQFWHYWLAHGIAIALLILLQTSSTIGTVGIDVDCEFGWGTGQYYRIDYFLQCYYERRYQKLPSQVVETEEEEPPERGNVSIQNSINEDANMLF